MDITRLLDSSPLTAECPHCGHTEDDDFEIFEDRRVQPMRCAGCSAAFCFALMECRRCGAECLLSWAEQPTTGLIDHLACTACSQPYFDHEASSLAEQLLA